ncbi:MAG: hypothetical protein WKF75_02885 [Singulisphaera sp.]
MKHLTVSDQPKVKDILSTLTVEGSKKGTQAALEPAGTVDFIFADGHVIKTIFVRSAQLDRAHWGQIYLGDTKFYDRINTIISEEEGKNINILKYDN